MKRGDDVDSAKSAVVLQAEIAEKVQLGYASQAIDIHAYKLNTIPGSIWAVRTLRRLLLQNNRIEVRAWLHDHCSNTAALSAHLMSCADTTEARLCSRFPHRGCSGELLSRRAAK